MNLMNDKKEEKMLLNALEFFVDYKFSVSQKITDRYIEMTNEIAQNDYALLCKKMDGTTKWPPAK